MNSNQQKKGIQGKPWLSWGGIKPLVAGLCCAPPGHGVGWQGAGVWRVFPAMNMDGELQKHYAQLLGLGSPWEVKTVELKLQEKRVEIELGWQWGSAAKCPECGRECSIHDCAPERSWRHLDTMQFTTLLRSRTPRSNCPEHGVKTMQVPWAAPQGRFTQPEFRQREFHDSYTDCQKQFQPCAEQLLITDSGA